MRPQTQNAGAGLERQAVRRKLKDDFEASTDHDVKTYISSLVAWLNARSKRTAAKAGGLGRRKKVA